MTMTMKLRVTGLLVTAALALPVAGRADTEATHRVHKAKKETLAPLPSGTRGPIPQVPLDAMPAVAPQVNYQDGLLTIVAPNSTLGDILRGVRKHTSADIEIPPSASERVVTKLGPAPAREVLAELLNGSRFNYILLGSPENTNDLVKVVLVARTGPETQSAAVPQVADGSHSPRPLPPTPRTRTPLPKKLPTRTPIRMPKSRPLPQPSNPASKLRSRCCRKCSSASL
jgi:hypothetical protein